MANDFDPEDLLQGLAALRLGLLSRSAFLEVIRKWLDDPTVGLLDRFQIEGLVSDDKLAMVQGTVDLFKQKFGNDATLSFAALAPGSSFEADPNAADLGDPFETLLAGKNTAPTPESIGTSQFVQDGTRYRILRPHAAGGLGVVYLAHDREVNRPVAFKEIKPKYAQDASSRDQFLLEAQVTGGLEHPGIVPIYGLGHHADGRPYYAMRFVSGDSLQTAIESFHARDLIASNHRRLNLLESERALSFRQLLGRFVDVCQAIAYAHDRGVLHRDLKPGNIMLGKYSETLVIDWGLAKLTVQSQHGLNIDPEGPLKSSGSLDGHQQLGIVGTPTYMSPEQARGETQLLGPASDIYSLGATLYCVLTGRSPHDSSLGLSEILRRVANGIVASPTQVCPDVPPGLNAICMHAMALNPLDRYSDAKQLADDIERWLGDEPIEVYREPWLARSARWARKNRTKVSLGLGALFTGLIATMVTLVLVTQEKARTEVQRARADLRFRQARQAVDEYLVNIIDNDRLKSESLKPTRLALLREGIKYYQSFLEDSSTAPEMIVPRANALLRLASIQREMGTLESAEALFDKAFVACEAIFQTKDPNTELLLAYAIGHLELAEILLSRVERRQACLATIERAESLLKDLEKNQALANTYESLAMVDSLYSRWHKESDSQKAMDYARRSADRLSVPANASNPTPRARANWAKSLLDYGMILGESRQWKEAIRVFSQARDIWRGLMADDAFRALAFESEAALSHELAILEEQQGRMGSAIRESDVALNSRSQLVFREGKQYLAPYAQSLNDHALRLLKIDAEQSKGEDLMQRAIWIRSELLRLFPDSTEQMVRFAESANNLSSYFLDRNDLQPADSLLQAANGAFHASPVDLLMIPSVAKYQAATDLLVAKLRFKQDAPEEAYQTLEHAIQRLQSIVQQDPRSHEFLLELSLAYVAGGDMKHDDGETTEAEEFYAKADDVCSRLIELSPEDVQAKLNKSGIMLNTAVVMRASNRPDRMVLERLRHAMELTRRVQKDNPEIESARTFLFMEILQLLDFHNVHGSFNESFDEVIDCLKDEAWAATDLVDIALAMSALLTRENDAQHELGVAEDDIAETIVLLLARAKSLGASYRDWLTMPELAPLRDRLKFQQLLLDTNPE